MKRRLCSAGLLSLCLLGLLAPSLVLGQEEVPPGETSSVEAETRPIAGQASTSPPVVGPGPPASDPPPAPRRISVGPGRPSARPSRTASNRSTGHEGWSSLRILLFAKPNIVPVGRPRLPVAGTRHPRCAAFERGVRASGPRGRIPTIPLPWHAPMPTARSPTSKIRGSISACGFRWLAAFAAFG